MAAATGTGGCSWLFVKPLPPDYDVGDSIECTAELTPPVVDTLFALSFLAGIVYLAGKRNDQNVDRVDGLIASQVTGFSLWGASAVYGYRAVGACSDAEKDGRRSYSHHLGVRHRAYGPLPPAAVPFAGPPPDAAPTAAAPAPVVTPRLAPAPQQGDDEKPARHSAPASKPWTLPQED